VNGQKKILLLSTIWLPPLAWACLEGNRGGVGVFQAYQAIVSNSYQRIIALFFLLHSLFAPAKRQRVHPAWQRKTSRPCAPIAPKRAKAAGYPLARDVPNKQNNWARLEIARLVASLFGYFIRRSCQTRVKQHWASHEKIETRIQEAQIIARRSNDPCLLNPHLYSVYIACSDSQL
jgi:hypothetical protein